MQPTRSASRGMDPTSPLCLDVQSGLLGEEISSGSVVALHSLRALEVGRSTRLHLPDYTYPTTPRSSYHGRSKVSEHKESGSIQSWRLRPISGGIVYIRLHFPDTPTTSTTSYIN